MEVVDDTTFEAWEKKIRATENWKEVEREYRKLLRSTPVTSQPKLEDRVWRALGLVYREKLADDESAQTVFELLVKRAKPEAYDLMQLALIYERAKRYDDALGLREQALVDAPSFAENYDRLFELHVLTGNVDGAWRAAAARIWWGNYRPKLDGEFKAVTDLFEAILPPAAEEMKELYADYAPKNPPKPTGTLTAAEWEWVVAPGVKCGVRDIYRLVHSLVGDCPLPQSEAAKALVAAIPELRLRHAKHGTMLAVVMAAVDQAGVTGRGRVEKFEAEAALLRPLLASVDQAALRDAVRAYFKDIDGMAGWQVAVGRSWRRAELLYAGDLARYTEKIEPDDMGWFASSACGYARKALGIALPNSA